MRKAPLWTFSAKSLMQSAFLNATPQLSGRGCAEPELVYVHEGRRQVGKERWDLKNARYSGECAKMRKTFGMR
jgi:hypothetical protein